VRIWFAANIPGSSQGGVARNMLGFRRELASLGHQVELVFADGPAIFRNYLVFTCILALKLLCASPDKRPAVVIARSTDGLGCALAVRLLGMRTRIVLHNHGWEERIYDIARTHRHEHEPSLFTWKSPAIRFPLLRLTLALSHACACGTIDEIRWLVYRFPRCAGKLRYAPNGVDLPLSAAPRVDWLPHFLCVGAAGWRKNTMHTISVFASVRQQCADARLTLVGAGSSDLTRLLPPGLDSTSMEIIATASMDDMVSHYRRNPFLITTSVYEGGHALALLEAMAGGCVVFARAIPSACEIIRDRHNGVLLPCADPAADAAIILSVLNDQGGLERMSSNARRSAMRNRWPRQGGRMNTILQRLIEPERT
jgi:glycosyltransferase involved in cell wall biosynthesis